MHNVLHTRFNVNQSVLFTGIGTICAIELYHRKSLLVLTLVVFASCIVLCPSRSEPLD